jgi:hypothetical protein
MLVATAGLAQAQNQANAPANLDGKYAGNAGLWRLELTVKSGKGSLVMSCSSNSFWGDVNVGPDGTVSGNIPTGIARRTISGNVRGKIDVGVGGNCGTGQATMTKNN